MSDFDGSHYGKLPWIKFNQDIPVDYEWYRNEGRKKEYTLFSKAEYEATSILSLFADLQYRYIDYRFTGADDDMADLTSNHYFSFSIQKQEFLSNQMTTINSTHLLLWEIVNH